MRSFVILLAFGVVASVVGQDNFGGWQTFKTQYDKKYQNPDEENRRYNIFKDNERLIEEHNRMFAAGQVSYEMGINEYSDLEQKEFLTAITAPTDLFIEETLNPATPTLNKHLPSAVDWRSEGAVTKVKNQLSCRSSWAFATTGVLEGQHFLKTKHLVSLSEQNLLECSWPQGNQGCHSGSVQNALHYVIANRGINAEAEYPYTGIKNRTCQYNRKKVSATAKSYVTIQTNEYSLMETVAHEGPIAVNIHVNKNFQHYRRGVFNDSSCTAAHLNYAALAVGYGHDGRGGEYWLVKNSMGTGWGEQGYIRMARNRHNQCGIASKAIYPLINAAHSFNSASAAAMMLLVTLFSYFLL